MMLSHSNLFRNLEDILYWIISTIEIFRLQLEESRGVFRGFSMAGILLAMLVYHKLLAKMWISPLERVINSGKIRLTKWKKVLRMKISRWGSVLRFYGRSNGKKENSGSKKKAKPYGHGIGNHGSFGDDAGSGGEQSSVKNEAGHISA